jgi:hypothetical protein
MHNIAFLIFALALGAALIYAGHAVRKESGVVYFALSFYGAALICTAVYCLILKLSYL